MIKTNSRAITLPFRIDGTGRVASTDELTKQIADRIRGLIGTFYGERVMRPTYGTSIAAQLFDTDDPVRSSIVVSQIEEAIQLFEPAVAVEGVSVTSTDPTDGRMEFFISYRLVTTGEQYSAAIAIGGAVTETKLTG